MGLEVLVRGFSPPQCHNGHPVEGGTFTWRDGSRHDVVVRWGGLGRFDFGGCRGCGLGLWGLCPLWAQEGPRPLTPDERALLGAPRQVLVVGR